MAQSLKMDRQTLDPQGTAIMNLGTVVVAWNFFGNDSAKPTINGIRFPDDKPDNLATDCASIDTPEPSWIDWWYRPNWVTEPLTA